MKIFILIPLLMSISFLSACTQKLDDLDRRNSSSWGASRHSLEIERGYHYFMYDLLNLVNITGQVVGTEKYVLRDCGFAETLLIIKNQKRDITVRLGPDPFLKENGINFIPGESVTVEGSQVFGEPFPTIIASRIKSNKKAVNLRDETGWPLWIERYHQRKTPSKNLSQ